MENAKQVLGEKEKGAEDGYDPVTEMREEDTREENTGLEEEEEETSVESESCRVSSSEGEVVVNVITPDISEEDGGSESTGLEGEVVVNVITPEISEEDGDSESTGLSEGEVVVNVITPDISEEDGDSESSGLSEGEVIENVITPDISEEDGGSESTGLSEEEEGVMETEDVTLKITEDDGGRETTGLPKTYEVTTVSANTKPIPPKRKWWIPKCFRKSSKNKVRNMYLNDSDETAQRLSKLLRVFLWCCTIKPAE
ncbi:uncharacterized protein LOC143773283 [Ranitomeya variabilis]|uniref:uncharacterized protein LOC143773283 n=1 Tax=Ranitomeya variabilis TaxID=490064 RepID=UPI004057A6DB